MNTISKRFSQFFKEEHLFSIRFFWIFGCILIVPFFLIVFDFISEYSTIKDLEERTLFLKKKFERKENDLKKEEKILDQIRKSHSQYLEDVLGSLVFLGSERQKWQLFSEQIEPSHPIKERVSFLEQGNNQLNFVQSDLRKNALFQESEEIQKKPIEISEEDLRILLSCIEGTQIRPHSYKQGSPQLLFKSFQLEKKPIPGMPYKTYQIQMQLIKRESVKKP